MDYENQVNETVNAVLAAAIGDMNAQVADLEDYGLTFQDKIDELKKRAEHLRYYVEQYGE